MFLFKNTKSIMKRIGMNMAVYGFASVFLSMILAPFLPEIIANYIYVLMGICSFAAIIGSIISVIWFFVELFTPIKPSKNDCQTIQNKVENRGICLFHEGDQYQGTHIELRFENGGEISIVDTGWWPVHRGASNGGQRTKKLNSDYFIKNSIDDFVEFLTETYKKDFSEIKNRQDIIILFETPIFKMKATEGQVHNFIYSGRTRYSPNCSSTCGYGSDDWIYLCEENGTNYLLMFTDNAEFGTAWMCTELLEGDYERLINQDVNFWGSIAYSKERVKTYGIRLTDVDTVRHLLPTSSRCCSKLTDDHYLR